MNFRSMNKVGLLATVLTTLGGMVSPAFADTTVQGFICDQRGSVSFQNGTSHDKKWLIPGINKVAVLVDASAQGPVGINYEFDPPIPFQFINWYYKQAVGSRALQATTVRYCTTKKDGSDEKSFDIQGGQSDRGGQVGDGWSRVVQDTRSTVPNYVVNGNGVIKKLTYIFKDSSTANNITLGRVEINQQAVAPSLITDIGPCSLKEKCTKEQPL